MCICLVWINTVLLNWTGLWCKVKIVPTETTNDFKQECRSADYNRDKLLQAQVESSFLY